MIKTLLHLLRGGRATPRGMFPLLPEYSRGLPVLTESVCTGCHACELVCPTEAIIITGTAVSLDRGLCINCGLCAAICPTGTIAESLVTTVAVRSREDLVLTTAEHSTPSVEAVAPVPESSLFRQSIHVRAISTGDNATDLELGAANNPIFDSSRFGIHFVASPRHADALVVMGPVPRVMQDPLRRVYDAMAEPRIVIAAGVSAISGGVHRGGYAEANGVSPILPVDVFIPGNPPHPWSLLHGILIAMGSPLGIPWTAEREAGVNSMSK